MHVHAGAARQSAIRAMAARSRPDAPFPVVVIDGRADIGLEGFQPAERRWQRIVLLGGLRGQATNIRPAYCRTGRRASAGSPGHDDTSGSGERVGDEQLDAEPVVERGSQPTVGTACTTSRECQAGSIA
jgi:hypothetical protein